MKTTYTLGFLLGMGMLAVIYGSAADNTISGLAPIRFT
jgi:hypothetical protein